MGNTRFHELRATYIPRYPKILDDIQKIDVEPSLLNVDPKIDFEQKENLKNIFKNLYGKPLLKFKTSDSPITKPLRVGVVLSGGQAPGGHNVICAICDALYKISLEPKLVGFVGGPSGILQNKIKIITPQVVREYLNTGGFDLLGSGRTKIETQEHFETCLQTLKANELNGLVIIGGDDSNTNAALLAEYLKSKGENEITIVGVPKTIDGDLKNEFVETSFGFYTASRVYASLVANICRDAISAKKYYHFIRLMGRSASRLTLEVSLLTHPNITLISEELSGFKKTINEVIEYMVDVIVKRADVGKNYGVVVIPEGLIEFIPEIKLLISELNTIIAENKEYFDSLKGFTAQSEYINRKLSKDSSYVLSSLPIDIQRQLLMDRDPHGNVQVSKIQTEKLIIELLETRLDELKAKGKYKGKFSPQTHFIGYEGRCAQPSNFDADYAYALGLTAVALIKAQASGYMAAIKNLIKQHEQWEPIGVPLVSMMNIEMRSARPKPVIKKSLVGLDDRPFQEFLRVRQKWAMEDHYRYAEPIQYFGPKEICDNVPPSLLIENNLEDEFYKEIDYKK